MDRDSLPRAEERMVAAMPAGRNGTVDEIVGAVLWLCSGGAQFVVGHPLSTYGGTTSGVWYANNVTFPANPDHVY